LFEFWEMNLFNVPFEYFLEQDRGAAVGVRYEPQLLE